MQRNSQVRVLPAMVLPMPKRSKEETNQNGGRDSASGENCVIFSTALVGKNYKLPCFSSSQRTNGTPQQAKLPAIRSPRSPRRSRQEQRQRQRTPLLLLLHCSKTRLTTPWNRSKLCPGVEDISKLKVLYSVLNRQPNRSNSIGTQTPKIKARTQVGTSFFSSIF